MDAGCSVLLIGKSQGRPKKVTKDLGLLQKILKNKFLL
jgi:hypothetical protein